MRGKKHTLYLEPGPPARVEMASQREELVAKLQREVRIATGGRKAHAEALLDAARNLPDLDPKDKNAKAKAQKKLAELTNALDDYGRTYELADIGADEPQKITGIEVSGDDEKPAKQDADAVFDKVLKGMKLAERKSSGDVYEDASKLNAGARTQEHGDAPEERASRGTSGKTEQSAHTVPTSFTKGVAGSSRDRAVTVNLPIAVHRKLDSYWKKWAQDRRKEGYKKTTAGKLFTILLEAIRHTPELTHDEAFALEAEASREIFSDLGLDTGTELNLPYASTTGPKRTDILARVAIEQPAAAPPVPEAEPEDEEEAEEEVQEGEQQQEEEEAEAEELPDELPED